MNKAADKNRGREAVFFTAVIFYVFLVVLFIFLMKYAARIYAVKEIDRILLATARSIPYLLPDDYHDRAVSPESISLKEYNHIEKKLTEIAGFTGMKYIWTDVLINGKVYLTSCNRTEQTNVEGLEIYYFMPYADGVSSEEMSAFAGDKPVFTDFTDRWGRFRAVFIPCYSPGGKKYLACAEFTMDYVEMTVKKMAMYSSFVALFFFFAFVPVFMSYVWNSKMRARELKEKNLEIEKSEENLRITLNSIGDGVIVVGEDHKIVMINPVAEELTGWNTDEAAGMTLNDVFCVNDRDTGKCADDILEKIIHERHSGTYSGYLLLVSKNGEEKIISENGSPIFDSENKYIGSVIVFRDVTERQRLEDELRQSQKLESIGQLAGGVAHDFNNMLAAIMGSAELLSIYTKERQELRQYSDIIINAAEKASELTHKLLAFSRKGKRKAEPFDMHLCIKNAISMLKRSIDKKIEIQVLFEADVSYVTGDNTLFENVILNIGINSRDAMPDGGVFSITTSNIEYDEEFCSSSSYDIEPGKYIRISLKDTGSGIPKKIKEKIFEPFFTTKKPGKGTGLGLSVVYGTVKDHHGLLTLESEEGKGTEIFIDLPVSQDSSINAENHEIINHTGSGRLLVIDDELLIRDTLENMLKSMSYDVVTASNGFEGLEQFRKYCGEIKAVFLDIIMPVMNGKETLMSLKKINPELPVIVISGFTTAAAVREILALGAYGFLQKPFKKTEITGILMRIEKEIEIRQKA